MTTIGHNSGATAPITDPVLLKKIADWYSLQAQATELAVREKALRTEIAQLAFANVTAEKGTFRVGIGHGKDLKLQPRLNYTIDKPVMRATISAGKIPQDVLDKVIRYRIEVVASELEQVTDPKVKRALASFITSKPGLPGLEIANAKTRG